MPQWAGWGPGSEVLLARVDYDAQYRNIVKWQNFKQIDAYLRRKGGKSLTINKFTPLTQQQTVRLDIPWPQAMQFNYVRVRDPKLSNLHERDDDVRVYYYFINDIVQVAPDTIELALQLDVWTTYCWNVRLRTAYVERGHLPVAATWRGRNHDVLRETEGLDLGADYMVQWTERYNLATLQDCGVMVIAGTDFTGNPGNTQNPHLDTAKGSGFEGLPNGADIIIFRSIAAFEVFALSCSLYPWVAQGIQSIQIMPWGDSGGQHPFLDVVYSHECELPDSHFIPGMDLNNVAIVRARKQGDQHASAVMWGRQQTFFPDGMLSVAGALAYPDWQQNYSKLFTSPFVWIELTNYAGQSMTLRPEYLPKGGVTTIACLRHFAPPSPRVVCWVKDYLKDGPAQKGALDGSYLDCSIYFTNFPTFSITNNAGIAALASQAHSIAFSRQSAEWGQQKALAGNQLAYDQASQAMATSTTTTNLGNAARTAQTDLSNAARSQSTAITNDAAWDQTKLSMANTGLGVVGNLLSGNIGGALKGGASIATAAASNNINTGARNAQTELANSTAAASTGISNQLASQINQAQNHLAAYNRDTNRAYADMVAKGDYANTIAGINARVQDTQLTQPSTSGQIGGDAFMLTTAGWAVWLRIRGLNSGAAHRVAQYFARYGYACNRYVDMAAYRLDLMTHFTYWKLADVHIEAPACPQMFVDTIRGIFESGTTVWGDPEEIPTMKIYENGPYEVVKL